MDTDTSSHRRAIDGILQKLSQFFAEYEAEGHPMPAELADVADWAMETGRWKPPLELARRKLVEDIARALREEYFTDDEGNRVRAKHPASVRKGGAQFHLWQDARTATHAHMTAAFAGRRNGVVGDLKQLKTDVDWYNRFHAERPRVQLVLDFSDDIAELEAAEAKARKMRRRTPPAPSTEGGTQAA